MTAPKFKIRCSQIGKIMTEPKTKVAKENGEISETAKSYCELWLKEFLYNRKKEITSKYMTKGNECEQSSIELINEVYQKSYQKNEKYFENDFCTGTPDIIDIEQGLIIDVKNSWDFSTFPLFETEIENKDYFYQLQGYMFLTKCLNASLIYTLNDMPDELIEREISSYCYRENCVETPEIREKFWDYHTYIEIPTARKIKRFNIQFEPDIITKVINQVKKCQNYINSIL